MAHGLAEKKKGRASVTVKTLYVYFYLGNASVSATPIVLLQCCFVKIEMINRMHIIQFSIPLPYCC